jgi:hypothetical protein
LPHLGCCDLVQLSPLWRPDLRPADTCTTHSTIAHLTISHAPTSGYHRGQRESDPRSDCPASAVTGTLGNDVPPPTSATHHCRTPHPPYTHTPRCRLRAVVSSPHCCPLSPCCSATAPATSAPLMTALRPTALSTGTFPTVLDCTRSLFSCTVLTRLVPHCLSRFLSLPPPFLGPSADPLIAHAFRRGSVFRRWNVVRRPLRLVPPD